jgi:hypothetical protein
VKLLLRGSVIDGEVTEFHQPVPLGYATERRHALSVWLGLTSVALAIICLLMLGFGVVAERRFQVRIPPGRDEDDFGGLPLYILILQFLPFLLAVVCIALGIAARAMGQTKLGWCGVVAGVLLIALPLIVMM